ITVVCGISHIFLKVLICPMYFGGYHESLIALNSKIFICLSENADITVVCGISHIFLKVLICPMYFGGYNESMALNSKFNAPACHGVSDWTVNPPVLLFNFSISQEVLTLCGNNMNVRITSQVGSGVFSNFSQIQFVNVSGLINSWDPSTSTINYRQQLMYQFSCLYPLQYLVNNTELMSLAVKDNNGTFVSTLSMGLYRFNVLLDRCYATTSPYPTSSTSYDLFIGCNRDAQTKIDWNGISQVALFSFEAFRFVEHKNRSISTFYLHCATRLCENYTCASLIPVTNRRCVRKREVQSPVQNSSDVATVSSGPISTRVDNGTVQTACVLGPFKTCRHFKIAQQSLREEMRADPNPGVLCMRASCKVSCSC
uniref:Si:dkey-4p15.5 n=1 Tax=Sinocyclocheilus grahami TaxID=75366 RepID=A0A672LSL9_SINGR